MLLDQTLLLEKSPPAVFWIAVFLISFSAMFYLGLEPDLIDQWYLVLIGFNVVMSLLALYFIVLAVYKLKRNINQNIIGSKFTWSFVKIIPVLVLVPVLSFYLFSFESIRDNLSRAESQFEEFNYKVGGEVDELYKNTTDMVFKYYLDRTRNIGKLIGYFDTPHSSSDKMKRVLDLLVLDDWACDLKLYNASMNLVASSKNEKTCLEDGYTASTTDFTLIAHFSSDSSILSLTSRMARFREAAKHAELTLNSSIIKTRFMMDFSSTILLTVLSALLVVLKMIESFMSPMHNLSLATREISAGNYDVQIQHNPKHKDMQELVGYFNEMSRQIRLSREGLDTDNLYLETILKYSYGVVALNSDKIIQLINPVIGRMLNISNEKVFVGQSYDAIIEMYEYLKPLFSFVETNIEMGLSEWSGEVELTLPDRHRLIYCQGARLDADGKTLGYVIVVDNITRLRSAQKRNAWGEVAKRMAHEIKNPLTPIFLSAQRLRNLFLDKLDPSDSIIIDKTTNTIIEQVASMDAMVSAFADYAKTPEIIRTPGLLNTLVNKSAALYDAEENIGIDLDLSGNLPELQLDSDSISRVLINLIKNAIEANNDKEKLNITIRTRYNTDEGNVSLTITDDGDGFPVDILDQVFEPYITTKEKGSGLGLAITQKTIEQHDGQIYASNIKPSGARITIEFGIIESTRSRNG